MSEAYFDDFDIDCNWKSQWYLADSECPRENDYIPDWIDDLDDFSVEYMFGDEEGLDIFLEALNKGPRREVLHELYELYLTDIRDKRENGVDLDDDPLVKGFTDAWIKSGYIQTSLFEA